MKNHYELGMQLGRLGSGWPTHLMAQSDKMYKGRVGREGEEGWQMISMKPTPAGLYFFIGS